jgi:hypothetical protein
VTHLGGIRVPLPAIIGGALLAAVLVIAVVARLPVADRLPLSPPILVALALWLAWIAFLASLRDSAGPAMPGEIERTESQATSADPAESSPDDYRGDDADGA